MAWLINFLSNPYANICFWSMVPVFELRYGISHGVGAMPFYEAYVLAVFFNLLPVPFILLLIRKVLAFMRERHLFGGLAEKIEAKAEENKELILKKAALGLFIFVAIPIPGTGAWTGALVAAMLDMRFKIAFPAIAAGVAVAGVIMTIFYYGIALLYPPIKEYFTLIMFGLFLAALLAVYIISKIKKKSK